MLDNGVKVRWTGRGSQQEGWMEFVSGLTRAPWSASGCLAGAEVQVQP